MYVCMYICKYIHLCIYKYMYKHIYSCIPQNYDTISMCAIASIILKLTIITILNRLSKLFNLCVLYIFKMC